jgi:predicted RNase H-like HicB family nuclease
LRRNHRLPEQSGGGYTWVGPSGDAIVTKPIQFTAIFRKVPEGYIGFVEELPGANAQGATLEEARENLDEAIDLVLEANRALAEEDLGDQDVIRERITIAS